MIVKKYCSKLVKLFATWCCIRVTEGKEKTTILLQNFVRNGSGISHSLVVEKLGNFVTNAVCTRYLAMKLMLEVMVFQDWHGTDDVTGDESGRNGNQSGRNRNDSWKHGNAAWKRDNGQR